MKIVLRRHDRPFAIFRCLAVAQALARLPGAEVFLECLENWRSLLDLCPSIKWKNPHHPFAVQERGQPGQKGHRPAGRLYDQVIDLDGDGPFEARWSHLGLPWWKWVQQQLAEEMMGLDPAHAQEFFGALRTWPRIEVPLAIDGPAPRPLNYVLVDAVSDEVSSFGLNAKGIEEAIRRDWPGSEILYSVRRPLASPGPARTRLLAGSYGQLAQQLAAARAVYAVNGLVFALSQSTLPSGQRLQERTVLIRPASERVSDPFGRIRSLFEPEIPAGVQVLQFSWGRRRLVDKATGVESFAEDRTWAELAAAGN